MDGATKVISTASKGWQHKCRKLTEMKVPFEIYGIQYQDFEFCRNLCSQNNYLYNYKMSGKEVVAVLNPYRNA